jgi:glycosyltransferase involved in cell wall biosynthesis
VNGAILIVTHFPSPYQVELFDRIARANADVTVAYLHRQDRGRQWSLGDMTHRALFLSDPAQHTAAAALNRSADLAVYNYYQDRRVLALLAERDRAGAPWAFWGERPGFKHESLGRMARRFALRRLHRSRRPIWGIGGWAVDAYRREFGGERPYVNLPYFSDLERHRAQASLPRVEPVLFVYSGSLSYRKGVDVLSAAFLRLAREDPRVRLRIVGKGDLESSVRQRLAPVADRFEMAGFMDWHVAPAAYAGGHFLCVPSRHDGWALVVPEGLAAGLPVIASDRVGAALDLIAPGRNGWLVSSGDAESLYQSMRSAARLSTDDWSAMSMAARCTAASHTLAAGVARFLEAADRAAAVTG